MDVYMKVILLKVNAIESIMLLMEKMLELKLLSVLTDGEDKNYVFKELHHPIS